MAKKRGAKKKEEFLLSFDPEDINSFVSAVNKSIESSMKRLNRRMDVLRKSFTKYEEPYSEVSQTKKGMDVTIKLPDVQKEDILLNITDSNIEIRAESDVKKNGRKIFRSYHRIIDLPKCSISKKTQARFANGILKIKIPYNKTSLKKKR
tara:strand:- start:268 stop:717 length:450 start_codon:yes stop_codon:yes gene_type:complete